MSEHTLINITLAFLALIVCGLWRIERALKQLHKQGRLIMGELDALKAQVAKNKELTGSAITLIQGLAAKIEASKNDPVALQALADELKAQDDALADAVTANTPAA